MDPLIPALWTDDDPDEPAVPTTTLVHAGNKIGAVYLLREETGAGFAAATCAVERLARQIAPSPAASDSQPAAPGAHCGGGAQHPL